MDLHSLNLLVTGFALGIASGGLVAKFLIPTHWREAYRDWLVRRFGN